MQPDLSMPKSAVIKIEELRKIVEEHPDTIPVPVIARFLGITQESLRTSIEQGHFKCGICWRSPNRASGGRYPGKKSFKILSVPFWMEYTGYMRERSP